LLKLVKIGAQCNRFLATIAKHNSQENNMVQSMTAFARSEADNDLGRISVEIKSVNNRYLEPVFRLPDTLRELEPQLRDRLSKAISRGKVECTLRFNPVQGGSAIK